ncbi:DUF4127 family protein [Streptomyces sp. NPDC008163]|uniref:DUF4127 family protein n=1 Tax=Streptomyces sp. NPDC008163 TaxID=3364818 RepID=UPI0036F184BB
MSDEPRRPEAVVALLPLDERPACAGLPAQIAAVAGVRLALPPSDLLPALRTPGDPRGLSAWLAERAGDCDAAVVSLEMLGHGGLIASRTGTASAHDVLRDWDGLAAWAGSGRPVHGVTLVTRTPDSADAMEEPDYWNPYGPALHRYSAALHRAEEQVAGPAEPSGVPEAVRADFLGRRLRNHTLNLGALDLVARGRLNTLVVGADDTAPWGLATAELAQLRLWRDRLGLVSRVAVRPGADEAVTALIARTLRDLFGGPPVTVAVEAVDPAGLRTVAPYENMPVADTAAGQIAACGAVLTGDREAGLHLLVHTPDGSGDWAVAPPGHRPGSAVTTARALAARARELLDEGHEVAVADCAQPNGADPLLVEALHRAGTADRLTAYAGWNTAGNTLGTAVAHGVTVVLARRAGTFDERAHRLLLAHRFIEDWGYMTRVRAAARTTLGSVLGAHDHVPPDHPVLAGIADGLARCAAELPELGHALVPASVRLPWHRTFEADFALTPTHPEESR